MFLWPPNWVSRSGRHTVAQQYDVDNSSGGNLGEIHAQRPIPGGVICVGALVLAAVVQVALYISWPIALMYGIPFALSVIWGLQLYVHRPSPWVRIPLQIVCLLLGLLFFILLISTDPDAGGKLVSAGALLYTIVVFISTF